MKHSMHACVESGCPRPKQCEMAYQTKKWSAARRNIKLKAAKAAESACSYQWKSKHSLKWLKWRRLKQAAIIKWKYMKSLPTMTNRMKYIYSQPSVNNVANTSDGFNLQYRPLTTSVSAKRRSCKLHHCERSSGCGLLKYPDLWNPLPSVNPWRNETIKYLCPSINEEAMPEEKASHWNLLLKASAESCSSTSIQ